MKRCAILEVITPHAGMLHNMRGGLAYTDQILTEAGLSQPGQALENGEESLWLRRCLHYLDRRFQQWLRIQLIAPLSLPGLFRVVRYRIRTYPTFIIGGETFTGQDLAELEAFIRRQAGSMAEE
ncbi:MAG: hypothetical protein JW953_13105 [Anaerolineae bacterium]|nr:hypothetical protein [Anaerolineae bacterium]